jgi:hypothetical protein
MKTKETKPITTAQIKKIHTLLGQQGLMNEKRTIIHSVSEGRTDSTKLLTANEARQLISLLLGADEDYKKRQEVFKAIYGLAWKMDIIYGNTDDDYQMNIAKLNVFCRERGTVKKNLTTQNLVEMRRTHRQFEAMYRKFENRAKK